MTKIHLYNLGLLLLGIVVHNTCGLKVRLLDVFLPNDLCPLGGEPWLLWVSAGILVD